MIFQSPAWRIFHLFSWSIFCLYSMRMIYILNMKIICKSKLEMISIKCSFKIFINRQKIKFSETLKITIMSHSHLQFLQCYQQHIMVTVVGAVSLQCWCLPFSGTVHPVGMINPSPFNVSSFCHQLDESYILKSLGNKVSWILLQAQVEVTSDQSCIT